MARLLARLNAAKVEKLKAPGMYADGGGLYLQVTGDGAKRVARSWIFRFALNGRSREMGLGSAASFGLAQARARATECRRQLEDGIDPIEARRAAAQAAALEVARALTFKEWAEEHVRTQRGGWRNAKHARQWEATLAAYVFPVMGNLAVHAIDTALVLRVLQQDARGRLGAEAQPLWNAKPETASRIRGRIEAILDAARARGIRSGENPARWRGHLDQLLPKRSRVRKVKHHAALPYEEIPAFMRALRARDGIAARALEFTILTVARTGETLGGRGRELAGKVWTVPAERMKGGIEHRVPLSRRALDLIGKIEGDRLIFAVPDSDRPLSNMAMAMTLRRMGYGEITVHGFRSTFRDWAAGRTNYPNEVVEMALAHAIEDKTEAAYRRGDLFDKRRNLMDAWASYCVSPPRTVSDGAGEVVSIGRTA